jgi:hypothetical protein
MWTTPWQKIWIIVGHRRLKNQCSWEIILIFQPFGSLWTIAESAHRARSTYGISSRSGGDCGSSRVLQISLEVRDQDRDRDQKKNFSRTRTGTEKKITGTGTK